MTEIQTRDVAQLMSAILWLGRRLRRERPESSVPIAMIGVMGTLYRHGPMPASKLAVYELLQPQSLTRTISSLEKLGLIERSSSPTDRRELIISLSQKGLRVLSTDMEKRRMWLTKAISNVLTPEETSKLLACEDILMKLSRYEKDDSV